MKDTAPGPICTACGTEYSAGPPLSQCHICEDERQYVPIGGQRWTMLAELAQNHQVEWSEDAPGIHQLVIRPHFAIGQRALLIETGHGNVLWDCIALLDDQTEARIRSMGRLSAIAISHPHYYTTNRIWAEAFDVPVFLHSDDAEWVQRAHPRLRHWQGDTHAIAPGLTLIRCGGHFDGATVLHSTDGKGRLFTGDVLQVTPDRTHVSVMWSYPNYVPVGAAVIRRIEAILEPYAYDAVHGAFPGMTIGTDGKAAVARSFARYLVAIGAAG